MRSTLLLTALVLPLLLGAGCQETPAHGGTNVATPTPQATPAAKPTWNFDAKRAFDDLKKQVAFGYRVPGTPAHVACRDWMLAELTKSVGGAKKQDFTLTIRGKRVPMSNVYAHINPDAKQQVLLCAHWDTRPTADQEIDEDKKKKPIAGANDGASGVAVLLELARVFKEKAPTVGVQIVLFDGEDYGPGLDNMFLGAKYYARNLALKKPDFGILIDMIGDKDLNIYRETNSDLYAPDINTLVFNAAKDLGITSFVDQPNHEIYDDHLSLNKVGIKTIDLIDFDYGPWHTLDDTPEQCSPESLKSVGDVLAKVIYDLK